MKKRLAKILVAAATVAAITAGTGAMVFAEGESIRLVNGKIEVDAQLKKLAEMYEEETGVHVEIESMGGGIDIQGTLKGYYQGDNMPDIFVNGGATDFANWEGLLVDMSDQEWAADTDAAYVNDEGTIGFPYTTEAVGLAYNADILEKAGVDPASLTSPDAVKAAFETIDGMKEELGIDAVVGYCAEVVNLYWSTGNHLFANYIDGGLDREDTTYIDMLNDGGQVDADRLAKFAEFVGLLNQYSDTALLVSGTYDQQILNFASGKYAFVTQGSWIGATMTGDDAEAYEAAGNFACGMIPYAFEDGMDTILTNSPLLVVSIQGWQRRSGGSIPSVADYRCSAGGSCYGSRLCQPIQILHICGKRSICSDNHRLPERRQDIRMALAGHERGSCSECHRPGIRYVCTGTA